jgi:hypothetical protein
LCISSSRFFICLRSLARRFWNHIFTCNSKQVSAQFRGKPAASQQLVTRHANSSATRLSGVTTSRFAATTAPNLVLVRAKLQAHCLPFRIAEISHAVTQWRWLRHGAHRSMHMNEWIITCFAVLGRKKCPYVRSCRVQTSWAL